MRLLQNTIARPVTGVAFGHGGTRLIAGGTGGYNSRNVAASTATFIKSHATKYLFGCRYDPLGRWAYVSDYLGGFRILPPDGGDPRSAPGSPHERHVSTFDISADGR